MTKRIRIVVDVPDWKANGETPKSLAWSMLTADGEYTGDELIEAEWVESP